MLLSKDIPTEAMWPGDPVNIGGGQVWALPVAPPLPAKASGCHVPAEKQPGRPTGLLLCSWVCHLFLGLCPFWLAEKFLWGLQHAWGRESEPLLFVAGPSLWRNPPRNKRECSRPVCSGKNLLVPTVPSLSIQHKADSSRAALICHTLRGWSSQQPCKAGIAPILQMGKLRLGFFKWWAWDSSSGSFTPSPVVLPVFHEASWLDWKWESRTDKSGTHVLHLLGDEMISGFPEKPRKTAASLALLQPLLEKPHKGGSIGGGDSDVLDSRFLM